MSRAKTLSVRMTGSYMGIKVNTSSNSVRTAWARINRRSKLSRNDLLRDIRKIFKARLEKRIPALMRGLDRGIRDAKGTRHFEGSTHNKHRPHHQIRNPLSTIVKQGTSYKVVAFKDTVSINLRVLNTRNHAINFHLKMRKVPRISTVWNRLDATCLPFVKDGHRDKVIKRWLEYSQQSLQSDLREYFTNRQKALSV